MSETLILSCRFHDLTGLYCPGCGSGRAVAATLRGDFKEAFHWNPMVYLLGVPSMAILGYEYVRVVFGVRRLKPVMLSEWLVSSVTVVGQHCTIASAAGWRVFSPIRTVWKTGNTPSIPLFSKLSAEEKSLATGSCRIVRCCLSDCLLGSAQYSVLFLPGSLVMMWRYK